MITPNFLHYYWRSLEIFTDEHRFRKINKMYVGLSKDTDTAKLAERITRNFLFKLLM